jgi:hypothetical protein
LSALDVRIDELYRAPLGEFIASRTALAKTLKGDEARRVKALAKPTAVPWAVNQVYWRARPVYDRLVKSGEKLRDAQVAALGGKKADIRGAGEAHRKAIADAVHQAETIAAAEGVHPAADSLMRTFEAISMAPGDTPGRWTKPLQPAGFEALAGVKVAPAVERKLEGKRQKAKEKEHEKEKVRIEQAEAARRRHEEEIREAEAALERAKRKMAEAEAVLRKTRER